ncbi:MAG: DedA family protein [Planctomycetota bacterium]
MEEFFFSFLDQWSYIGLILVLLAAGFGLPIPEDIPLLAAGWLVHKGEADLGLMIAAALIGVMLGDTVIFALGRRYGMQIFEHRFLRWIAKPWLLDKAGRMYRDHGAKILFAARFWPGLRAIVFLNAGIFRVRYWKFLAIDGAAALISVPLWVWAGWKFSGQIESMLGGARLTSFVMGGLLGGALIVWLVWEYYHNLRKKNRPLGDVAGAEVVRSAPLVSQKDQVGRPSIVGKVVKNPRMGVDTSARV